LSEIRAQRPYIDLFDRDAQLVKATYNGSIFGAHYTKRVIEVIEKYFQPPKFEIFSACRLAEMSKLQPHPPRRMSDAG